MSKSSNFLTPYGASKIINAQLKELIANGVEVEKYPLPGPMFYNYTSRRVANGEKPFIAYSEEHGVDEADLQRWFKSYCEKKGYKVEAEDPEQESFDMSEAQ